MRPLITTFGLRTAVFGLGACLLALGTGATSDSAPPSSPREVFNTGTRQLHAGKLREAEASLEAALASQQQHLQPPALYNLGLVRFGQGVEELKKGPPARPTLDRGRAASQRAGNAIREAEDALASNDVQRMVAAYLRGRGARKELKAATQAVRRALKLYGAVLARWERSADDFRSAMELNRADADARHNADVLDRCIAKLVDSIQEMQQCANGMCDQGEQLGDDLKKLKGRIPAPDMPPGAGDDEEEDDEELPGNKPGEQEAPSKDGQETHLSPEQAGWLLEAYRLDSERRLPMGQGPTTEPRDRSRPPW